MDPPASRARRPPGPAGPGPAGARPPGGPRPRRRSPACGPGGVGRRPRSAGPGRSRAPSPAPGARAGRSTARPPSRRAARGAGPPGPPRAGADPRPLPVRGPRSGRRSAGRRADPPVGPRSDQSSTMSTLVWTPSRAPATPDQGADGLGRAAPAADDPAHVVGRHVQAQPHRPRTLLGLDDHRVGLVGQRPGQVHRGPSVGVEASLRLPTSSSSTVVVVVLVLVLEGVDRPRPRSPPARRRSSSSSTSSSIVLTSPLTYSLGVAHLALAAANSSHAPEVLRSFSTRSVGWAPWRSHLSALSLSMVRRRRARPSSGPAGRRCRRSRGTARHGASGCRPPPPGRSAASSFPSAPGGASLPRDRSLHQCPVVDRAARSGRSPGRGPGRRWPLDILAGPRDPAVTRGPGAGQRAFGGVTLPPFFFLFLPPAGRGAGAPTPPSEGRRVQSPPGPARRPPSPAAASILARSPWSDPSAARPPHAGQGLAPAHEPAELAHGAHAGHAGRHAAPAHAPHHLLHLLELLEQLVDVLGGRAAAPGDADPAGPVDDRRVGPLPGVMDRMMASTRAISLSSIWSAAWRISLDIPGSSFMMPPERAHLLDLLELLQEVVQGELALDMQPAGRLRPRRRRPWSARPARSG